MNRNERERHNMEAGCGFEVNAAHPNDVLVAFEDGPERSFAARNLHSLKYFLDFARTAGVAEADAVTGLPWAQEGPERDAG